MMSSIAVLVPRSAMAHNTDTDFGGLKVRSNAATGGRLPIAGGRPSVSPVTGSASWASMRCSISGDT